MNKNIIFFLLLLSCTCHAQYSVANDRKKSQDSLIEKYLTNGAQHYNYNYQMAEWQRCLDEGLAKDSTVARLWQEKAMPYFKARKYEIGMGFIDKAVRFDRKNWLPYRGFIKCIFSKQYNDAITDFQAAKTAFGNDYIMDHTYNFYIALCYLQRNEYMQAKILLKQDVDAMFQKNGEAWVNPTSLFYYGIAMYELTEYADAITIFNRALVQYEHFSDAKYYKAICLARLDGSQDEIKNLIKESREDAQKGYTIGEYNTVYETYPYQQKWQD